MAVALTGVVLVAAMRVLGSARAGEITLRHRAIGMSLARDLMEEILVRSYGEEGQADAIGKEAGEDGSGRLLFDDVDDYAGWSASPPQFEDGNKMSEHAAFTRSVKVEWVEAGDLARVSGSSTGLKRITVTVTRADRRVASLVAYRSDASGVAR